MPYVVGDKVTISAEYGGWSGFVISTAGVADGGPGYHVVRPHREHRRRDRDEAEVGESDIVAGPLALPTYSIGQNVALDSEAGTITAIDGDGTHHVTVAEPRGMPRDAVTPRAYALPAWRLAIQGEL